MRNKVKSRSGPKLGRGKPQAASTPSTVQRPPEVDQEGRPTLKGFRPDERWMVRVNGD